MVSGWSTAVRELVHIVGGALALLRNEHEITFTLSNGAQVFSLHFKKWAIILTRDILKAVGRGFRGSESIQKIQFAFYKSLYWLEHGMQKNVFALRSGYTFTASSAREC